MNLPSKQMPQLMSISEASQHFGLSKYSLRKGVTSGKIPHIRVGVKYFICVEPFQQLIRANSFEN